MNIKFADITKFLRRERIESVMKYERYVIAMTFLQLNYLVYDFGNYMDNTPETYLSYPWVTYGFKFLLSILVPIS